MPQKAAGMRMLAAVSVPTAPSTDPTATALAEPELDPPAHR
jgi:glycerol dehydrogenase-like iron-containing ADH family enzyme